MKHESTTIDPGFKNLADFHKRFPNEESCREHLELIRWKGNIVCPHCKAGTIYRVNKGKNFKCGACRKWFSVKVGTIFEQSPLPLSKWFLALHFLASRKKGISSMQLADDIGVTQKTAWFMLGRLRWALRARSFETPLRGIVEADETYVGGEPHFNDPPRKRGRGTQHKTAVLAVVQRDGEIRSTVPKNLRGDTVNAFLTSNVEASATLYTDELNAYKKPGQNFADHQTVNHSHEEYARKQHNGPTVHTNTIEGAFSLFKRMVLGTYHHVSREHLHRYTSEFDYRYNTRTMKSPARFVRTLEKIGGRLTYKVLIANGTRAQRIKRTAEEAAAREEWIKGLLPF